MKRWVLWIFRYSRTSITTRCRRTHWPTPRGGPPTWSGRRTPSTIRRLSKSTMAPSKSSPKGTGSSSAANSGAMLLIYMSTQCNFMFPATAKSNLTSQQHDLRQRQHESHPRTPRGVSDAVPPNRDVGVPDSGSPGPDKRHPREVKVKTESEWRSAASKMRDHEYQQRL